MLHHIVYFTCWRYLWTRKIILLSILGVTIGVTVLIVVMSVMSGFQQDFKMRLQGTLSELTFTLSDNQKEYEPLLQEIKAKFKEDIKEISPRLECLVLVGTGNGWRGGMLVGIDEEKERAVGNFETYLVTSKKNKSEALKSNMSDKSPYLLFEWIAENVEEVSKKDYLFFPPKSKHKKPTNQTYFRVYFKVRRTYEAPETLKSAKTYTSTTDLQAFIFDEKGKIVAEEFCPNRTKRVAALPQNTKKLNQYQNILDSMTNAFKAKELNGIMSHFSEDFEQYGIKGKAEEEYRVPYELHLNPNDPFDRDSWANKRYFPVLVGTEFKKQRGILFREHGELTILGGYYNRKLKKIRSISKKFTVVGSFKTGMHEYDSNIIYCPIQGVQQLQIPPEALENLEEEYDEEHDEEARAQKKYKYPMPPELPAFNRISHFSIALKDKAKLEEMKQKINNAFYKFGTAETWMDKRRILLDAVNLEKSIMNLILNFIILLAALSIIFVLWLMVAEKQKDIGIFLSMGANRQDILAIFVINGCLIAILGALFGSICGVSVALHVNELEDLLFKTTGLAVFPRDVYYLERIPVNLEPWRLSWVIGWTIFASLILSMLPAHLASKSDPVKCLSYQ